MKEKATREAKGLVRAMRIEIFAFAKDTERRDRWLALSKQMARMYNMFWRTWLIWHEEKGTVKEIEAYLDARKRGEKPKLSLVACDKHLANKIYHTCSAAFPMMNARTRVLAQNKWQSTISKRKAAHGSLSGWWAILLCNEGQPSFRDPQPIPFDKENANLIKREDGKIVLRLRIDRLPETEGDKKAGSSIIEDCDLMVMKKKSRQARVVIDRLLDGTYEWKGSSVIFDGGKWFALLAYEMPKSNRELSKEDNVLYVRPGKYGPWRCSIGGADSFRWGGRGTHIEYGRKAIIRERASRKEHYRWAGSNQKGHGRGRAEAVWVKLSSRWRDFSKRYNHEVTASIVRLAINRKCNRIVYLTPNDRVRNSRFLSTIGNDERSGMSWDYFQFGTLLASKCEKENIEYGKAAQKDKTPAGSVRSVRKSS